jgi:DinB family protein
VLPSSQAANIISMITSMIGRPETNEAAPYYFGYINRVSGDDILSTLQSQIDETLPFLRGITEEKSLFRYAPEKWSIRQLWGHVNDTERVFLMRALWFARNFDTPLPSFDQDIAVAAAKSDDIPWARHVEEFREIRLATISFFRNLPEEAWSRKGVASGNPFTVRACAFIVAGHTAHHQAVLNDRYFRT